MGVVVYFAGLRSVLEGLAILPFLYTSDQKKFKKMHLQEWGFLIYNQPRRTVLVHIFYQKMYLKVHRKETYTP